MRQGNNEKQYEDLNAMLRADGEARTYFDALPDYVKEQIATRPAGVKNMENLRDFAENLLRGDD